MEIRVLVPEKQQPNDAWRDVILVSGAVAI